MTPAAVRERGREGPVSANQQRLSREPALCEKLNQPQLELGFAGGNTLVSPQHELPPVGLQEEDQIPAAALKLRHHELARGYAVCGEEWVELVSGQYHSSIA